MDVTKFVAGRILLLVPIAILLALIIAIDNELYRALFVAGLVVMELVRDTFSVSEAVKIGGEAARLPPKI
jgi:hypothetical protein